MVRVEWTDSGTFRESGWESKEQLLERTNGLINVVTVGYLVHEEEDKYFIALSSDFTNDHYYGVQIIGKFAVHSMKYLDFTDD